MSAARRENRYDPRLTGDESDPDREFPVRYFTAGEILRRMAPLIRPQAAPLLIAAGMVALAGAAMSLVPLFTKYVIDVAIPARDLRRAALAMGVFVGVQAARMLLWFWAQRLVLVSTQRIVFHLRSDTLRHLQRLCMRFHDRYPSGFLYDRVFGQSIIAIGVFQQTVFQQFAVYLTGLLFSLVFCLWLSPAMTLFILVASLGYVAAGRILSPRIYRKSLASSMAGNRIVEYLMDKLRGTSTIQAFAMESRVQGEFEERLWPMHRKWLDAQLESMRLGFVTEGLGYLLTAGVLVGGAYAILEWDMKLGTLVAFISYQATLIGMVNALVGVYTQFMSARAGFNQLFTVLETESTVAERPGAAMPQRVAGEIEFRDVVFGYDRKPVLRAVTFAAEAGRVTALVGRSGCGKTTIAKLCLRFYDPDSGSVRLDGTDVRDLPLRPYRSLYGVVLQDPYLFNETVAENLRYAKPDATEAEMVEALEQARALDFVREFDEGLHHRVGEGGTQLSGGQRQRIAIARCMLLHPRILIMDEATSALDNETERYIQEALARLMKGRTSLVIAHRLSTIRGADRVVVVDAGQVVEQGTFDQLLAARGLFCHLYDIATSGTDREARVRAAGFA